MSCADCTNVTLKVPIKNNVSVIIGAYNRVGSLSAILRALRDQKLVGSIEIIVADAGSEPPVLQQIHGYDFVDVSLHWKADGKYHRVRSFNEGVRIAKHDIVLLLDDDVIPASEYWVHSALAAFNASPELSIVRMPLLLDSHLQLKSDLSDIDKHLHHMQLSAFDYNFVQFTTANLAIYKSRWNEIGGLKSRFDGKYGFEDLDFHKAAKERGLHYGVSNRHGCAVHVGTFFRKRNISVNFNAN